MIAMTFSTIGNRKVPLYTIRQVSSTTTYLEQTSTYLGQGQSMGQSMSQSIQHPAIFTGMFQRIQNTTGCRSCGGAV